MNEYFLQPGYIYVSDSDMILKTVLGSCISVCLWDSKRKKGGMNHYIYPRVTGSERTAKYGDMSLPYLLKMMIKSGSDKNNLIAHIIGGADNMNFSSKIGDKNIKIARKFMEKSGIHVASEDVGGSIGKKVVFNTATGEVVVYKCMSVRKSDWYE